MLFKRRGEAPFLCVLAISIKALGIDGTVITDCNAASEWVRFLHPVQWRLVDFDDILAADWRHPNNQAHYYQHKSRKCAEVLVPHRVPPELLIGAYVIDTAARNRLLDQVPDMPVRIDPVMFFQSNSW